MNAGHFSKNLVSTGDLNRGRRTESRVLFGYFLHDAKSDNPFSLAGSSEVRKPRISAHSRQLRAIQLNPFEAFRFAESFAPFGAAHSVCLFRLTAVFPVGNFRGFANLESAHKQYTFA